MIPGLIGFLLGVLACSVVAAFYMDRIKGEMAELKHRLTAEIQQATRLEIENGRLLVRMREAEIEAVRAIDRDLAAKVKAVAA